MTKQEKIREIAVNRFLISYLVPEQKPITFPITVQSWKVLKKLREGKFVTS